MSPLKRDPWRQLASGLYVPPLLHRYPGYPCGGCCPFDCSSRCIGGCAPAEVEIEVEGIIDAPTPCSDCDELNGIFILPIRTGGTLCDWFRNVSPTTCVIINQQIIIQETSGLWYVLLIYNRSSGSFAIFRSASLGATKPSCTLFDTPIALPIFVAPAPSSSGCSYNTASASVVAV